LWRFPLIVSILNLRFGASGLDHGLGLGLVKWFIAILYMCLLDVKSRMSPIYLIVVSGTDVFSLGLLVCSVYNGGRSLIQAGYNPAVYMRHIDQVY